MPYSEKQKNLAQMALHNPEKVWKKNRSILSMSRSELHDFATKPIEKKSKK